MEGGGDVVSLKNENSYLGNLAVFDGLEEYELRIFQLRIDFEMIIWCFFNKPQLPVANRKKAVFPEE